jgi:hypothetical protein
MAQKDKTIFEVTVAQINSHAEIEGRQQQAGI